MALEDHYSPWDIERKFIKLIKNQLATEDEDKDEDDEDWYESEDNEETLYELVYWANRHRFNRGKVNQKLQEYFNKKEGEDE